MSLRIPSSSVATSGVLALVAIAFILHTTPATAATLPAQPKEAFPLWAKAAPGALGTNPAKDIPTLTPFFPAAVTASWRRTKGGTTRCG